MAFSSSGPGSLGNQLGVDSLQQQQQLDAPQDSQNQQEHQQQMSMTYNQQHMMSQTQQQQQPAVKLENGGVLGGVKLEQQMGQPDQSVSAQMLRSSSGGVKLGCYQDGAPKLRPICFTTAAATYVAAV